VIDLAAAETLRLNAALAARDASLLHAEATINALTLELAQLRRIRYGAKSEVLNAEQRDLFQETQEADISACEAETERVVPEIKTTARRERAGRQPLPDNLPRIEVQHEPESCACGKCGKDLTCSGLEGGWAGGLQTKNTAIKIYTCRQKIAHDQISTLLSKIHEHRL
jgi:hypothetical protein